MSFRSQQSFRLLVGDPSLGHTKPSCLGFLAKLFIPFSIFDKSLHSFCLPTYIHPATHLLPPTHRPTSTHPPTIYLPIYIHLHTHPTIYLHPPTSTQLLFTIFALSAGFLLTKKSILEKQVTRTPLTSKVRGVLVTCFSNIDFSKAGNQQIMQKW